jgi:ubiquinone/menaquinone biosynthesis C-methylase UbiE
MPIDKSPFYYGFIFHKLLDPQLEEARQVAVDLIPEGASVLDIASGTGKLCFALREQKRCTMVGVDLSLRMLNFARKSDLFQNTTFLHKDAADLSCFNDQSFDYATMMFLVHELTLQQQVRALKEALRVAQKVIIIDSAAPLPRNASGIGIRLVEALFGHEHNPRFKDYLSGGGMHGIFRSSELPIKLEYSSVFWGSCREVAVVSAQR